jgi:hypothetical protein
MGTGSFRFVLGEFECVSVSDGALNYPPESFFSNTPWSASKRFYANVIYQPHR